MSKLTPEDLAQPFPFDHDSKNSQIRTGDIVSVEGFGTFVAKVPIPSHNPVPDHYQPFRGQRPLRYIDDADYFAWTCV